MHLSFSCFFYIHRQLIRSEYYTAKIHYIASENRTHLKENKTQREINLQNEPDTYVIQ